MTLKIPPLDLKCHKSFITVLKIKAKHSDFIHIPHITWYGDGKVDFWLLVIPRKRLGGYLGREFLNWELFLLLAHQVEQSPLLNPIVSLLGFAVPPS